MRGKKRRYIQFFCSSKVLRDKKGEAEKGELSSLTKCSVKKRVQRRKTGHFLRNFCSVRIMNKIAIKGISVN